MALDDYFAGVNRRHEEAVARGEHDAECEWEPTGFYICHCSKRRREAVGFTQPPSEDLDFPPPSCPKCGGDLWIDDAWHCGTCQLTWDSSGAGDTAQFTDDYGDLSRCADHGIRAHVICQTGRRAS